MVLASTPDTGNLEDVAQLADKIMEVAAPSVASVHEHYNRVGTTTTGGIRFEDDDSINATTQTEVSWALAKPSPAAKATRYLLVPY